MRAQLEVRLSKPSFTYFGHLIVCFLYKVVMGQKKWGSGWTLTERCLFSQGLQEIGMVKVEMFGVIVCLPEKNAS